MILTFNLALLPNGTTGVANSSIIPMSFASVGSNGINQSVNTINNTVSQHNVSGLYRTTIIAPTHTTSNQLTSNSVASVTNNNTQVFTVTDSYLSRSKSQSTCVYNGIGSGNVLVYSTNDTSVQSQPVTNFAPVVSNSVSNLLFCPKSVQVNKS